MSQFDETLDNISCGLMLLGKILFVPLAILMSPVWGPIALVGWYWRKRNPGLVKISDHTWIDTGPRKKRDGESA